MLKVFAIVNNRRTLFCGLERESTTRLHLGQPIVVDVQAMLARTKYRDVQDVVIFAGETMEDIAHELSSHFGPLPEATL